MKRKYNNLSVCLILLILLSFVPQKGYSQFVNISTGNFKSIYSDVSPVCDFNELSNVEIPNTTIESVALDEAGGFYMVTAVVNHPPSDDKVKVYIALPVKNWNGRFYGTGGGGYMGGHRYFLNGPVKLGFAAGATDAGHDDGLRMSGSFALDTTNNCLNWQEIRDYAYLGIHDMTVVGKALIKAFYGKPARYSYFVGGSNGGRQGITEAQRYPEDYDGVLAYYPAINLTKIFMGGLWPQAVMYDANNIVSEQKQIAVTKAAVEACDGNDGMIDGVIDNPGECDWNPVDFVGTKVGEEVFTEADAEVIRKIWEGPRTHDGKFLWYGLPRGATIPHVAGKVINATFYDWPKYFIKMNPDWNISQLSINGYELMWNQSMDQFHEVFFGENPDISSFADKGEKLLIIHGLADQLVPYQGSIKYLESVQEKMGGSVETSKFLRLFLSPGIDHYLVGAGPKPVNTLDALMRWVEEAIAPDSITAEQRDSSGKLVKSRQLLPYPKMAK